MIGPVIPSEISGIRQKWNTKMPALISSLPRELVPANLCCVSTLQSAHTGPQHANKPTQNIGYRKKYKALVSIRRRAVYPIISSYSYFKAPWCVFRFSLYQIYRRKTTVGYSCLSIQLVPPFLHGSTFTVSVFSYVGVHTPAFTYTNTRSRIVILIGTTLFISCPNPQMWSESDRCCSAFAAHLLYSQ